MSEPDFDIDAAAEQFDKNKGEAPPNHPEGKQEYDTFDGDEPAKGHKSYDEYIADGGDPDRYKGKQAFEDERERIAENKRLRGEVKSLKDTVQQTAGAVDSLVDQARKEEREKIEARLHEAKENEDFDAFEKAKDDLEEHDKAAPKNQPAAYQEPDVIVNFRSDNPMIDAEAEEFDAEFNDFVEGAYNDLYHKMSQGGRKQLTDKQIGRLLNRAMKEAKDIFEIEDEPGDGGEPDRSPRNDRGRTGTSRRRAAPREREQTAEDFKIENPKNNRDHDASGVRDMIRANAVKAAIKAGKSQEDAEAAGDAAAKNFERSLTR